MARQATLLETWSRSNRVQTETTTRSRPPLQLNFGSTFRGANQKRSVADEVVDLGNDNDDDEFLAIAIEASKIELEIEKRKSNVNGIVEDHPSASTSHDDEITGFDRDAGKIWIYPTNFPIRNYQFEIIKKALFYNTLVTLPTGLGKTFIAAVVMYNFYRWYPEGKVIFMAPTKPLVAQQVEACYNIMGIPQDDVAEMTGTIQPTRRIKMWMEKRVFFLTPQVINNDLQKGLFPPESIKCIVIDEAHKAQGEAAYCQVVRQLKEKTKQFRILALSATPGSDLDAVQQVLNNLLIAHLELRSEDSPEIQKYTHERSTECIVLPLTGELRELQEIYERAMQGYLNLLTTKRLLYATSVQNCSLTGLLAARNKFFMESPPGIPGWQKGLVLGAFANAIGLFHGYILLTNMGMKSLYNHIRNKINTEKTGPVPRELKKNADLQEIYNRLCERFADEEAAQSERLRFPDDNESFFDRSHTAAAAFSTQQVTDIAATSHPKLVKLVEILVNHFKTHGSRNTRVIVFAQFRDVVEEITELLAKQKPLIRPMKFVGQAGKNGKSKGISQKKQLEVVKRFKEGGCNTLVSTSVGEEGLDIGEVDLIICYDATPSPVRSVQRMGRTGRKREGRIVVLVTEGKEQNMFNNSEYSKKRVHKAILANKKFELYRENRRMVPMELKPECVHMHMTQEKPYQNMALLKQKAKSAAGLQTLKRFSGQLSELEMNEWERDFKVRDADIESKLLKDRTPLKMIKNMEISQRAAVTETAYLNRFALWQNRPQRSITIGSSTLRDTLVKVASACQRPPKLPPIDDLNASACNDIMKFCRPRLPSPVQVPAKRKLNELQDDPKRKRGRKTKTGNAIISDSCQLIAQFKSTDFYTTSTGQQLNLTEIFPTSSHTNRSILRNYDYSNTESRFRIPVLKASAVIAAMKNFIGE